MTDRDDIGIKQCVSESACDFTVSKKETDLGTKWCSFCGQLNCGFKLYNLLMNIDGNICNMKMSCSLKSWENEV